MRALYVLSWFLGTFLIFLLITRLADSLYYQLVYRKMSKEKQEQVQYWLNHPGEYPRKVKILDKRFEVEKELNLKK